MNPEIIPMHEFIGKVLDWISDIIIYQENLVGIEFSGIASTSVKKILNLVV